MSSTSSAPASSDSPFFTVYVTPSATQSPSAGNPFGSQSTPLYLFTFLATLFVLLIVSSAIVMRSFFIRRRFRREIEHALAAGNIIVPPTAGAGTRRRPIGEKPKLWDTSVKSATAVKWSYITPVSAKISASLPSTPSSESVAKSPPPTSPFAGLAPFLRPFSTEGRRGRRRRDDRSYTTPMSIMTPSTPASPPPIDTISPTPPSSEKEKYDPEEYLSRATEIQVSMLIAMPDPNHHQHHHQGWDRQDRQESDMYKSLKGKERSLDRDGDSDSDANAEEGVPDVVFGIARVPFRNPTPEITYPPT